MNTLAHFALAYPDPHLMLGQFLGDFTKGPVEDLAFSHVIKQGIRAHRAVDARSEQHVFTSTAKARVQREHRRYVGIVLDVYTDYLLTVLWDDLMDDPRRQVIQDVHTLLEQPDIPLPRPAERVASALVTYNILEAYGDPDELPEIMDRIGSRLRRPVALSEVFREIQPHESELLDLFPEYFRDMQRIARQTT